MTERKKLSEEKIACRAHEFYVQRGGAHGKDVEDWVRAEKELEDESLAAVAPASSGCTQAWDASKYSSERVLKMAAYEARRTAVN